LKIKSDKKPKNAIFVIYIVWRWFLCQKD